jgi:cyclopropane-fatty-acyl-phospholipid synthase
MGGLRIPMLFHNCNKLLHDGGKLLIHCITTEDTSSYKVRTFISKHIFPGAEIPNVSWVVQDAAKHGFLPLHIETFGGQHYARTLLEWRKNLHSNKTGREDPKLVRMFDFYLAFCEAIFTTGECHLTQFVFVKSPVVPARKSNNKEEYTI